MSSADNAALRRSRRRFLREATLATAAVGMFPFSSRGAEGPTGDDNRLVFGLVTDVHYADTDTKGTRYYRDSRAKLAAAVEEFHREKVAMVVELGDLINAGPSKEAELEYLETVQKVLEPLTIPRHFVLGNHCVDTLTKGEFLKACGREAEPTYYSFDMSGYHFVVLDADFLQDGMAYAPGNFHWTNTRIPKQEQDWLAEDLAKAKGRPTVVFAHQILHDETDVHGVKNAPEVRAILEASGDVIAVFQGHMHTGAFKRLGGISYCTLRAMIEGPGAENNAFAIVTLQGRNVAFKGLGKQPGWASWNR